MKDDDGILDEERLAAWAAAEPPAGFADRVMAARKAEPAPAPPRRGWRRPALAGALALVAAAAAIVAFWPAGVDAGALVATRRTEVALGARAVAVAEPEAAIAWRIEGRGRGETARVEQTRGDVFYRVERGGRFVVATPAGDVVVKGTCFRVEVMEMKLKQTLGGAAAGALVTAAVLVTVYEGRVSLANARGTTEIAAGEHASAGGGEAPGPATPAERAKVAAAAAEVAAPASDATREQLLARDGEQRKTIAALQAQLRSLETELAAARERGGRKASKSFYKPTPEELLEMVKSCAVQFDTPPLTLEPVRLPAKMVEKFQLRPDEVVALQRVHHDVTQRTLAQLRALYAEVTGVPAPDDMIGESLRAEIEEKTGREEILEARKQLSKERAGLVPPPENLHVRPPAERMLRLMSGVGDEFERELAAAIGPAKAAALREANDGWPNHSSMSGCSGPDDQDVER
jgi:hypothetical protein